MILGISPLPLGSFTALPGRMAVSRDRDLVIVDNANSGTNRATTLCAAQYARSIAQDNDLTLVIGQAASDGAVCEGFSFEEITKAIEEVRPTRVIVVGPCMGFPENKVLGCRIDAVCATLGEGRDTALRITEKGSIVLSVKTWR
jgi:hypothetical protein